MQESGPMSIYIYATWLKTRDGPKDLSQFCLFLEPIEIVILSEQHTQEEKAKTKYPLTNGAKN